VKFNDLIFDLSSLNIYNYTTLPSLTFATYRCKYLNDYKIPLIVGQTFHDIRKSYTGGSTDVFIPYGENVKGYDVNSLYPNQMLNFDMPVGTPTFFEGDITKIDPNAFGFFSVEITAPIDMNRPILQTKVKTKTGFRTIAPLGI
jgi:DNA polymerase type B, organellar and viral